jgi:hypothetical protein
MNYLNRTMLALAETGDTEMIQLLRCFSARLTAVLTPSEIEAYARYLLAPNSRADGVPRTLTEQMARTKAEADPVASVLGIQIMLGLARRKRALHGGFGRN